MGWGSRQGPASFDPGPRLRALAELLERPRGILEAIGGFIVKESGKAFREQRLGNFPWKPRVNPNWPALLRDAEKGAAKPPQRRFQERPALMDTGLLARSIAHRVVSNTDVEVGVAGVAKAYGDKHQVGGEVETAIVTKAIQHRIWLWIKAARKAAPRAAARAAASVGTPNQAKAAKAAGAAGRAAAGLEKVRWLLNPHLRGQRIRHRIHARPFIGLPGTLVQEIERTIGVSVRQVR